MASYRSGFYGKREIPSHVLYGERSMIPSHVFYGERLMIPNPHVD